jgi:hypothetical protein
VVFLKYIRVIYHTREDIAGENAALLSDVSLQNTCSFNITWITARKQFNKQRNAEFL